MSTERQVTERGFRVFLDHYQAREGALDVVESSLAFEGPHVRIFQGDTALHLSLADAIALSEALHLFITEAYTDQLTETPDDA